MRIACRLNLLAVCMRAEAAFDEIEILNVVAAEEQALGHDARVVRIIDHFMHTGPHGKRTCVRISDFEGDIETPEHCLCKRSMACCLRTRAIAARLQSRPCAARLRLAVDRARFAHDVAPSGRHQS